MAESWPLAWLQVLQNSGSQNSIMSRLAIQLAWAATGPTYASELSVDRQGFLAKWSLLWKLPAVTYPR